MDDGILNDEIFTMSYRVSGGKAPACPVTLGKTLPSAWHWAFGVRRLLKVKIKRADKITVEFSAGDTM